MFTADGGVLHFNAPKVQAAVGANTYAASAGCGRAAGLVPMGRETGHSSRRKRGNRGVLQGVLQGVLGPFPVDVPVS